MNETTPFLKKFGKRIAILRKRRGMSQEEFADVSGKMINTISNIERGLSDPKITTLLSIAKALNISVETLFNENATEPPLSETVKAIIDLIKDKDEQTLAVIEKQIKALLELK